MTSNSSVYKKHFFISKKNLPSTKFYNDLKGIFSSDLSNPADFLGGKSNKKMFDLTQNIVWICNKCGHMHIGITAPNHCPICNSSAYEIKEN